MNKRTTTKIRHWFFEGMKPGLKARAETHSPWWNVMCLTGLDYFGSLGYAPGIAALAAGVLAPSATLVLIILTLCGALPMYKRVAEQSPHGQGSISMLAKLIPGWAGKAVILILIGFAATDFIITITLSAADAASHISENNFVRGWCHDYPSMAFLQDHMGITFVLLGLLCIVFLLGFKEAIVVAVVVVWAYLLLNVGVAAAGCYQIFIKPEVWSTWQTQLFEAYKTPLHMTAQSLILFPSLALGMSGFETGVAVMPLVKGDPSDTEEKPAGRIRGTKKLLTSAALIMCCFLLISSVITTLLIPQHEFKEGGQANGRALAYIAHHYINSYYGTIYDIATIFILWFSGASSLAGLLSLVPRYLPRFGMAPEWARATRPLVLFFGLVSFVVTYLFKASVDAQGGAYATGVLVLMTSAACAVFLSIPKKVWYSRLMYAAISLVFIYTTFMNMKQRPEGIHIAMFFILTIFIISFLSRLFRATELRSRRVEFADEAAHIIDTYKGKTMHIVSHKPGLHDYTACAIEAKERHYLEDIPEIVFLEVTVGDASEFSEDSLVVNGRTEDGFQILQCTSAAAPNAIGLLLLAIRNITGAVPHAYMYWTEGNPLGYAMRYLFFGEGETAPVTREILRQAEPDPKHRPRIHVV